MESPLEILALESFQRAAKRVPAYRALLREAKVDPSQIIRLADFVRLPILEKKNTFQRFEITELCLDGKLGNLGTVLTSSGHSGIFAYGLTDAEALAASVQWVDDALDSLFQVRSRPTFLINTLSMGVKVHTSACALAETSVRPDMAVGLIKALGKHFAQVILVGETPHIKRVLEMGRDGGIGWEDRVIHVIVGGEPVPENARRYFEGLLGLGPNRPTGGMVVASMGVAELGINLFAEAPPAGQLPLLRRTLHENPALRREILGPRDWVPPLLTYDPRRIFVEFDSARRLIVTTLERDLRVPLVRYATGDRGQVVRIPPSVRPEIEAAGISWELMEWLPIVAIEGRGDHAVAGDAAVYPEAVKEGIYHEASLAAATTANFRLLSGPERVRIRVQLAPGVQPSSELRLRFQRAIGSYVSSPFEISCEVYETFGSGMSLDYEQKFQYLKP
jgi:phenylacetate-CoA ligase